MSPEEPCPNGHPLLAQAPCGCPTSVSRAGTVVTALQISRKNSWLLIESLPLDLGTGDGEAKYLSLTLYVSCVTLLSDLWLFSDSDYLWNDTTQGGSCSCRNCIEFWYPLFFRMSENSLALTFLPEMFCDLELVTSWLPDWMSSSEGNSSDEGADSLFLPWLCYPGTHPSKSLHPAYLSLFMNEVGILSLSSLTKLSG